MNAQYDFNNNCGFVMYTLDLIYSNNEMIEPYIIFYITLLYCFIEVTVILIKIFGIEEYLNKKMNKQ